MQRQMFSLVGFEFTARIFMDQIPFEQNSREKKVILRIFLFKLNKIFMQASFCGTQRQAFIEGCCLFP